MRMTWQRKHTLIAGLALILLTNAVTLLGVVYNRSGEPDSRLLLSQRELWPDRGWRYNNEDSSLVLRLRWRAIERPMEGRDQFSWSPYYGFSDQAEWLDAKKLVELGFDVREDESANVVRRSQRQKQVWLVLELNGAAYQRSLAEARAYLAKEQSLQAAVPGNQEFERRLQRARDAVANEENKNSRLFAIDAGLDADALRARYPMRDRYAIVSGRISSVYYEAGDGDNRRWRWHGYIKGLDIDEIHVPLRMRQLLGWSTKVPAYREVTPFEVILAFGQRHEPWLLPAAGGE